MGRQATGQVLEKGGRWFARLTLGVTAEGERLRPALPLPWCTNREAAEARCAGLAELLRRLRAAQSEDLLAKVMPEAARATPEQWPTFVALVDAIERGQVAPAPVAPELETFEHVGRRWTSGDLARSYSDFVRAKTSVQDDIERLEWLYKTLGSVPVKAFTLKHYTDAMAALPPSAKAPATRRQYAQVIHKVLALAVWPLQLIKVHPMPKGAMPKIGGEKAKGYLFPEEEARLLACTEAPYARRLFYGFLAREGCRAGEAASLAWRDLDLATGELTLDRNKTDDPRSWTLDPGVWRALVILRGRRATEGPEALVFVRDNGRPMSIERLAEDLRRDLRVAGITRAQLFERSEQRMQVRAHDLRGTFTTLALALGRSELWVTDRTGHGSSEMVRTYTRTARSAKERALGWLVDLDRALPELLDQRATNGGSKGNDDESDPENPEQDSIDSRSGGMADAADSKSPVGAASGESTQENRGFSDASSPESTPVAPWVPIARLQVVGLVAALDRGDKAAVVQALNRLLAVVERQDK